MEAVFWGKVHQNLSLEGWQSRWYIFITNTRWVKVFCRWQMLVFGQKCDKESGGQVGGQTVGQIYLCLVKWRTCVVIRSTHPCSTPPAYSFTLGWFTNNANLYYLQRQISARVKFHPSPHLKLSHRGGCGELAQDSCMQMAVWMGLLSDWLKLWLTDWLTVCLTGCHSAVSH